MSPVVELMVNDGTVAIIPIRFVPSPKHRLAEVFDRPARQKLTEAMLEDVLAAIETSVGVTKIVVVTNNEEIPSISLPKGFEVFKTRIIGLNAELLEAVISMTKDGWEWVIIVLADLPLLKGDIIDQIILHGKMQEQTIIAQDWRGTGTNILFTKLPLQFHINFGHQSFRTHIEEFEKHNHQWLSFHSLESALDIDDLEAIQKFMLLAQRENAIKATNTYQTLLTLQSKQNK